MFTITRIVASKRRPNLRKIYFDGTFALACNVNVVARFRLAEGTVVTDEKLREIELDGVRQKCMDRALVYLGMRLHGREDLARKLRRGEWGEIVIQHVLDDLTRLGYLDDERFARTRALLGIQRKHHGPRRVIAELQKSGVTADVAQRAMKQVCESEKVLDGARRLVEKQAARLRRVDPAVARRRLAGMLSRRGFEYESVRALIDEAVGSREDNLNE